MKQYINKESLKVVGNAGYRIGKEIVIQGTKTVAIKGAASAVGGLIANGIDGVKQMDLNDVLGDVDRAEKKVEKRRKRQNKREAKQLAKEMKAKMRQEQMEDEVGKAFEEAVKQGNVEFKAVTEEELREK